jgi:vacuolar protein sorting-associated protein 13A/C
VSLDVRASGPTQILEITDYNAEYSVYRPRHRESVSVAKVESAASSQEAFEAVTEEVAPSLALNLDLEGVGISLINRKMFEVVYVSANALKFEYSTSAVAQAVNLTCGSFQIDNQLHDAIYPVVLQPTPIAKESSGIASLPTIQGSVIWLNDQGEL